MKEKPRQRRAHLGIAQDIFNPLQKEVLRLQKVFKSYAVYQCVLLYNSITLRLFHHLLLDQ